MDVPDRLLAARSERALHRRRSMSGKTTDDGQSWERISPDLTRDDPTTLGDSGGPITHDQNGVEIYGTIFTHRAVAVKTQDMIWTGSDDGLVHITRDGGKNWTNVTPHGHADVHAHQPDRRVAARRRHGLSSPPSVISSTTATRTSTRRATTARPGRRSSTGIRHGRFRARRARRPEQRAACCSPARSTASTSRSTTARSGNRCSSTCRSRRCTGSRCETTTW